ncbi:MAG: hypothetical protein ACREN1_03500 [Candidatus Dormibacteria bacterium]
MDPDDRLRAELGEELRRALAEMHLTPVRQAGLRGLLVATSTNPWRRWLDMAVGRARNPRVWGPAVAVVLALAIATPLATSRLGAPPTTRHSVVSAAPGRQQLGGAANADPARPACPARGVRISATPAMASLAPGRRSHFQVVVVGSTCPLQSLVSGPSAAGITVTVEPSGNGSAGGLLRRRYLITWTGRPAPGRALAAGPARLADGSYTITLRVASSPSRARISVAVEG